MDEVPCRRRRGMRAEKVAQHYDHRGDLHQGHRWQGDEIE
jgi:hypothetical protein